MRHVIESVLGATILLPRSSLAGAVLDFARAQRATVFYASPFHYNLLAKDRTDRDLDGVRLAVSTADGLRDGIGLQGRYNDR